MKRPLAVTGFVYLAASAAAVFLGQGALLPIGAVLLLCFAVSLKSAYLRKNGNVPLALAAALAAFVSVGAYTAAKITPVANLAGKPAVIEAELTDLPYEQNGRFYYSVNAKSLRSRDGKLYHDVKLLVYCDEPLNVSPSDIIAADVKLSASQNIYDISKGVAYRARLSYPQTAAIRPQEDKPIYYYPLMLRRLVCEKTDMLLPQNEAAFAKAFLLGDSHSLDSGTLESLRIAGLSHVIVVSGLHAAIIVHLIMLLFTGLLRMKKRTAALICIAVLVLYMALAGFPPSVVRAGIMQIVMLICALIFRRSDPVAALGLSLLVILAAKPYAAADISLLLSFSATFGIITAQKPMSAWINGRLFPVQKGKNIRRRSFIISAGRSLVDIITVTLSAVLFSLPVTILYFRQVPLYGVLSSLLVTFTLPLLMGSILLMLVMGYLLPILAAPFSYITMILIRQILFSAEMVSGLPFARVELYYSFVPLWVVLCAALAAALYFQRKMRFRVRLFALAAVLTFIFGYTADYFIQKETVTVFVPDTGQGVTALVRYGDTSVVLACGGDRSFMNDTVSEIVKRSYGKADHLLLLGRDRSVSSFAERLLNELDVYTAGVYDAESCSDGVRESLKGCSQVFGFNAVDGKIHDVETGGISIESLRKYKACAVFVRVKGLRILLCCGGTDCAYLPEEWRSADILIVNGEQENTDLLGFGTLIISDSEKYSDITYRELYGAAAVRRTYEDGSITLRLDRNDHLTEVRESNWLS